MLVQLGLQLLLPVILLTALWRSSHTSRFNWVMDTVVIGLALLYLFVTARWDFTSYYLRLLLLPLFALLAFMAYRRITPVGTSPEPASRLRDNAVNLLLILALGWLSISAMRGYLYPGEAVELSYPLQEGVNYVGGGGNSRWINNHNSVQPQRYALDIVGLNRWGNRGTVGASPDLERYAIFGRAVVSPCSGTVLVAVDGFVDQRPPARDAVNIAGNHVLIACEGVEILLAHLQQGSVVVREGESILVGAPVGKVGNSGSSSQPHLHIHAERGGTPGRILNGEGVPIRFEQHFLVRNSVFRGGS